MRQRALPPRAAGPEIAPLRLRLTSICLSRRPQRKIPGKLEILSSHVVECETYAARQPYRRCVKVLAIPIESLSQLPRFDNLPRRDNEAASKAIDFIRSGSRHGGCSMSPV
jgi:hypothetical protein